MAIRGSAAATVKFNFSQLTTDLPAKLYIHNEINDTAKIFSYSNLYTTLVP